MKVFPTALPDLLILEPTLYSDERGRFFESYNHKDFAKATGVVANFVQDNHSHSRKGVLRGLHYQIQQAQGKLVRVIRGEIFDVAVDIRPSSATFGRWASVVLSEFNNYQCWVPPGYAHGYLVVSESADVLYKTTDYYAPQFERVICWNDPTLGIDWPLTCEPILSPKDHAGKQFSHIAL